MNREKSILMSGLVALSATVAIDSQAEDKAKDSPATDAPAETVPSEDEISESLRKLIFVPHDAGAPEVTDAGGVRAVAALPRVELLAPDRMARTLSPAPTLYWHISTAAEGPVRFTLLADDVTVIDPLLELEVDGIDREGIYGVSLDDYGLTLEHGQRYVWSIAVSSEGDGFGSDLVAQTMLEYDAVPGLAATLDDARPEERAIRLAAEGYWYDAVNVLSDQIGSKATTPWKTARAQLLDQAGRLQAARFDRQDQAK